MPDNAESKALASYWLQHTEAWQSSGKTQQAYCEANKLSYHRFGYWLRKFRQQAQSRKDSGFVPVIPSAPSQSAGLSLAFPSGLVLRGIAGENLPLVYQLLRRLS